ncbi:type 1 glutamine amidotransferase [Fulvivirga sp. RKSG066]|uniref:type 1 glutamine amidotransferase domain-containing protein n=1 Tax=Fulvivirga aurantia TaxID=2529383 RepID=UPI0012BBB08D|nr:type 1 glutamine amidotransferase domain-containing protein [Fulvivirga aurantia]MTI21391.1 type 1 glutamine amidotransferase [Fulvivirga aurantia]
MDILRGKKIAILVEDGFEEVEFTKPKEALENQQASVDVISPKEGKVRAWNSTDWGNEYEVTKPLKEASADDYNALLLPGGVFNPDKLRANDNAVQFVKQFFEKGKPIAAICHGPWTLIETGALQGRKLTSWPSLKTDLKNAGATWVNEEVVTDQGLVTSRNPDDIPAFCAKMIEEFCEGVHEEQKTV